MRAALAALIATALGACGAPEVDLEELAPLVDYRSWPRRIAEGPLPAHGDTIRYLYANEVAASWSGGGPYPFGTVVVKEIYARGDDGSAGALDYLAIARRLEDAPPGGEVDDGWLFTLASEPGSPEFHSDSCWRSCHVASPFGGLFSNFSH